MMSKSILSIYFLCAMILIWTSSTSSECNSILRTTCISADQITSMYDFSAMSYVCMISKLEINSYRFAFAIMILEAIAKFTVCCTGCLCMDIFSRSARGFRLECRVGNTYLLTSKF